MYEFVFHSPLCVVYVHTHMIKKPVSNKNILLNLFLLRCALTSTESCVWHTKYLRVSIRRSHHYLIIVCLLRITTMTTQHATGIRNSLLDELSKYLEFLFIQTCRIEIKTQ
jgi:hypothetical protein